MLRVPTTLNRLEIFVIFMERLNMHDVAELLSINILSVYRSIHRLEEDIGYLLFKKSGRNLEPLPSAILLRDEIIPFLGGINTSIMSARSLSGASLDYLRIGILNSLSISLISYLNNNLPAKQNAMNLTFTATSNLELLNMLAKFELDAAVLISWDGMSLDSNFVSIPVFKDTLVYVVSKDHETANWSGSIGADILSNQRYMMLEHSYGLRHLFDNLMDNIGHKPEINSEFSNIFSLMCAIQSKQFASLIPSRLKATAEHFGLCVKPLSKELNEPHDVCLITNKAIEYTPQIKWLRQACQNYNHFYENQKD